MDQIKKIFNFHCLAFILLTQVSCKQAPQVDEKKSLTTKTDTYVFHVGDKPIHAELAILPKESETGLMFRDELKSGTGMLFVFKDATPRKFWMKNTRIPLDIGYFDENGILKEIYAAKPFDKTGVPSKSKNIQFVLELNKNDYRAQGIQIGDRINLDDVKRAITARNLNPKDYLN
jgi:uncharacterized membrane protein (UPF0127 family)